MFEPNIQIGSITLSTYTTVIGLALLIGGGFALYRTPSKQRLQVFDILIAGLIGGLILARVEHVLLNWNHFAFHTSEILQVNRGGLDLHGALVGAGIGMMVMSRWRDVDLKPIIDSLTLLLPLLSLAIWWGCWSASCRYGLEVATLADYPSWFVWEGRDIFGIYAPRFHTQQLGIFFSMIAISLTLVLFWRKLLYFRRFWLLTALVMGMIFFITFLQGDYSIEANHIRITQYLDGIFIILALYRVFR